MIRITDDPPVERSVNEPCDLDGNQMNLLSDWALAGLAAYGVHVLLLTAYIGSLGIPFPITLVIVAAGAFTRQGFLDWRLAVPACLLGAMLADHSEYLLGHWAGGWLERRFSHKKAWQKARTTFQRQGGWAILLTRFWLTPLAPAINVLAGSHTPYLHFVCFDLAGELLWVLLYGGLGYLFAGQWMLVSQTVSNFSVVSLGLAAAVAGILYLRRRRGQAGPSQE